MADRPDDIQLTGSEYGGVAETFAGGIQPKGAEALTNGEKLRLGYLTGNTEDTSRFTNLEDRRQMMGLRPADGRHPTWLTHVNPDNDGRLESEAERLGYGDGQ